MYRKSYRSPRPNNRSRRYGRGNRFQQPSFHPSQFITHGQAQPVAPDVSERASIDTLKVDARLIENIRRKGFKTLTPIQNQAINPILDGKNVVGVANTGTGKTAAFIIPLLQKFIHNPHERVLIVLPTRELAMQIQDEVRSLTMGMYVSSALCIGGASLFKQTQSLRRNPQFIIGTPGRLKDLIERNVLDISGFGTFVLDEVDRMLDMGFIHDIRSLIAMLPAKRQSLFFSATLSPEIRGLISTFAPDHIMVSVATEQKTTHIKQDVMKVNGTPKQAMLLELLEKQELQKVLVFVRTKRGADRLSRDLYKSGHCTASIHGNKTQRQRTQAIRMFSEDRVRIMIATDVASRGIDIDDITHVINYDAPATKEDYIHRIGRTGRANKTGTAITFVE